LSEVIVSIARRFGRRLAHPLDTRVNHIVEETEEAGNDQHRGTQSKRPRTVISVSTGGELYAMALDSRVPPVAKRMQQGKNNANHGNQ
jgi:hypothetical protein